VVRRAWGAWMRVARRIGDLQVRLLLMAFYFVVLAPFALVVRWGSDPLSIKPGTPRGWGVAPRPEGSPRRWAARQF
jgi:hypothetical protein